MSATTTVKIEIERDAVLLDVVIEGWVKPATRDVYYLPNGDPGYPGDPAEIEIQSATVVEVYPDPDFEQTVTYTKGQVIELSAGERDSAEAALLEAKEDERD